jgi:hypothetical protein
MNRRSLRLEWVAGLGIALAVPGLALAARSGQLADADRTSGNGVERIATQVVLAAELHEQNGRTRAALSVTVSSADGEPATGSIVISENGRSLAGAALDAQGQASLVLALPAGLHELTAAYAGDVTHRGSLSQVTPVRAASTAAPDFQISVAPATLSLTPGTSGFITASVTPENSSSLTAPMFVTLSCSGLPDQSSCTFTPANIEILPNAATPITSSMVVLTQQASASAVQRGTGSLAMAILLPGAFALGGLSWCLRRHAGLQRLSLVALLGLVSVLGTAACNSRYNYYNHGPPPNPATPAGTYTVDVTAQSSNGVTATTHTTTLALTIQ